MISPMNKESAPADATGQGRTTVCHYYVGGLYLTRLVRQISAKTCCSRGRETLRWEPLGGNTAVRLTKRLSGPTGFPPSALLEPDFLLGRAMSSLNPSETLYRETPCEHGLTGRHDTWPNFHFLGDCPGGVREQVTINKVLSEAVTTDGAHHKQWYLELFAAQLGVDLPDHEPGIAP